MNTVSSIEIECPIEVVFELTIDHVPEWSTIVVEDRLLAQTSEGVGTTFRVVTEQNQHRMEFAGVVTEFDPPYLHSVKMTGKHFDIDACYEFVALSANRTRVTQTSSVTGRGFTKIVLFLLGGLMSKGSEAALQKELKHLKAYCERPVG